MGRATADGAKGPEPASSADAEQVGLRRFGLAGRCVSTEFIGHQPTARDVLENNNLFGMLC